MPYFGISVFILPRGKTHVTVESDGIEEALDTGTGEDVREGHAGKQSRLLNSYGSPVVVRGQNENRSPLDVKRMSLNLAALSFALEETSIFLSY